MSNHHEVHYHEREDKSDLIKRLIIGTLIALIIIILFFLLRGCNGEKASFDKEKTLLEAGKEYYQERAYKKPQVPADCSVVTLETLLNLEYLKQSQYDNCEKDNTYVKVCMLESKTLHYVPILACDSLDSNDLYGNWKEGTENDIVIDESDVKFSFQMKYLDTTNAKYGPFEEYWASEIPYNYYKTIKVTKYYRYRDLQYLWNTYTKAYYPDNKSSSSDVKEYYVASPAAGYTSKDSVSDNVYKWFKVVGYSGKDYYMKDGSYGYSATAPSGYTYNEGGVTYASRTRNWTEVSTPTTNPPTHFYKCNDPNDGETIYYNSYLPCDEQTNNPTFTELVREFYSCDGAINEVSSSSTCYACSTGSLKLDNTSCGSYGTWSYSSSACSGAFDLCQNLATPVTLYKWFNYIGEQRSYYPSGSTNASGEKTYYAASPATGYYKDSTTKSTAYKWYKLIASKTTKYYTTAPEEGATKTNTSLWTNWSSWSATMPKDLGSAGTRNIQSKNKVRLREIKNVSSSDWITLNGQYSEDLDSLIKQLKTLGYEVETLQEVYNNGELKYAFKMFVRNKEE